MQFWKKSFSSKETSPLPISPFHINCFRRLSAEFVWKMENGRKPPPKAKSTEELLRYFELELQLILIRGYVNIYFPCSYTSGFSGAWGPCLRWDTATHLYSTMLQPCQDVSLHQRLPGNAFQSHPNFERGPKEQRWKENQLNLKMNFEWEDRVGKGNRKHMKSCSLRIFSVAGPRNSKNFSSIFLQDFVPKLSSISIRRKDCSCSQILLLWYFRCCFPTSNIVKMWRCAHLYQPNVLMARQISLV